MTIESEWQEIIEVWHSIKDFGPDTVFFVWNSRGYEEEDYIKDYDEFLKIATNK